MSKNIGIVYEGPTDYVLLKGIVNQITGEDNHSAIFRYGGFLAYDSLKIINFFANNL
jgi:hypothetical protein